MRRLFGILILTTIVFSQATAQLALEFQSQYCSFDMGDLRKLQDDLFTSPVPMTKVTSFPSYFGFKGAAMYMLQNNIQLGLSYSYTSTGGRVQYKDYSGSITGDQLTNATSIGVLARSYVAGNEKVKIGFSATIAAEFTKLALNNTIEIGADATKSNDDFKSTGIMMTPSLILKYSPLKNFFLTAEVGYHFAINQDTYRWTGDGHSQLHMNGSNSALSPNWDGVRAGIGLGYLIHFKKP